MEVNAYIINNSGILKIIVHLGKLLRKFQTLEKATIINAIYDIIYVSCGDFYNSLVH